MTGDEWRAWTGPRTQAFVDFWHDQEERVSQCDCCGEMKAGCVDTTYCGMDTHACPKCRDAEEDEAADRGDHQFHQAHDQ